MGERCRKDGIVGHLSDNGPGSAANPAEGQRGVDRERIEIRGTRMDAMITARKLTRLLAGEMVVTNGEELDEMQPNADDLGAYIRTLPNPNRVGVLDVYIAWIETDDEKTKPLDRAFTVKRYHNVSTRYSYPCKDGNGWFDAMFCARWMGLDEASALALKENYYGSEVITRSGNVVVGFAR